MNLNVRERTKNIIKTPDPETFLKMIKELSKEKWLDIGRVLINNYANGMNLWMKYSPDPEDCKKYHQKLTRENFGLTIKTLAWYAKEDSPNEYKEWERNYIGISQTKCTESASELDVAEFLYRKYWLYFVCSDIGEWYFFDGQSWIPSPKACHLRQFITENIIKKILEPQLNDLEVKKRKLEEGKENNDTKLIESDMKKLHKIMNRLKKSSFRDCVIKLASEFFLFPDFKQLIDKNPYLLGVKNGVLEFCEERVIFRNGKPEDYITKNTNIPYVRYTDEQELEPLLRWFQQVFPDEDLLNYFCYFAASCLNRGITQKHFYIMTGSGDNSKTMIKKLFEATFGSYTHTFPITEITGKPSNASNASPQKALAQDTCVCFMQEPDENEFIRTGILKEHTGGDTVYSRKLYENGSVSKPTYKLVLFCNHPPIIPNSDKAIKNRVIVIPFLSTWVNNPPETEEEQRTKRLFKKDPRFENKIPELAPKFLFLLTCVYPKFYADCVQKPETIPPIIVHYTERFWNENDPYSNFENLYIEEDMNSFIPVHKLYEAFKDWYKKNFSSKSVPNFATVKSIFTSKWGDPVNGSFQRKKLKGQQTIDSIN